MVLSEEFLFVRFSRYSETTYRVWNCRSAISTDHDRVSDDLITCDQVQLPCSQKLMLEVLAAPQMHVLSCPLPRAITLNKKR